MKTILINVFDTAVAKNIFMPQFTHALSEADNVRCVVLAPESKVEEFKRDFPAPNREFVVRPRRYASRLESFALFAARNTIPTHTVRQIQEEGLDGSGRLPLGKYLAARAFWLLGHSPLFRFLLKRVSVRVFDDTVFSRLFDEYKPDLAFATTIYAVDDIRFLKAARRRGICTLGMVKSWDNFTSKDLMLIPPERLVVHNEMVRGEAVALHRYPAERITVVGVPQFDWYADGSVPGTRSDFFSALGLDPGKKLITYTAMGLWLVPHERDIIALLYRLVSGGKLAVPAQLLVRMHPAYPDEKGELQRHFPGLIVDEPGSPVRDASTLWKADWKFSLDDVRRLAATLKYSDVTLNCGSTMILDAVCFDTPVIGIAFDGEASEPSYWRSSRRLFKREHCEAVVKTGGVRLAHTEKELVDALNTYLKMPEADREGRARIVRQQAGEVGHAAERLARAMIDVMKYAEE